MSNPGDLDRMTGPPIAPSDQPDPRTKEEHRRQSRGAPTATEREVEANKRLYLTLNDHIDHHKSECDSLREAFEETQYQLERERRYAEDLAVANGQLEERSHNAGYMAVVAAIMIAVGGTGVSIAGAWPEMPNEWKITLSAAGAAFACCGCLLLFLPFLIKKTGTPIRRATRQP